MMRQAKWFLPLKSRTEGRKSRKPWTLDEEYDGGEDSVIPGIANQGFAIGDARRAGLPLRSKAECSMWSHGSNGSCGSARSLPFHRRWCALICKPETILK